MYDSSAIHDALNSIYENLVSAIEDFEQRGSGWVLDKFLALDIHFLEFDPLRATLYIPLPTCIQNRKAEYGCKVFFGLLLLAYMEIPMQYIVRVYLIT